MSKTCQILCIKIGGRTFQNIYLQRWVTDINKEVLLKFKNYFDDDIISHKFDLYVWYFDVCVSFWVLLQIPWGLMKKFKMFLTTGQTFLLSNFLNSRIIISWFLKIFVSKVRLTFIKDDIFSVFRDIWNFLNN